MQSVENKYYHNEAKENYSPSIRSGRVIAGEFDGQRIELHEINRFDNTPVELPSGWHWNLTALYQNILDGIQLAVDRYGDAIVSLGIDTWGVDYGLLDKKGAYWDCLTNTATDARRA